MLSVLGTKLGSASEAEARRRFAQNADTPLPRREASRGDLQSRGLAGSFGRVQRLWPLAAKTAPGFSGLLALLLLAFLFIAANGSAHAALHQSTSSGPGHCAVCLLLHGQVAAADTIISTSPGLPTIEVSPPLPDAGYSAQAWRLPPGRAPPAFDHLP